MKPSGVFAITDTNKKESGPRFWGAVPASRNTGVATSSGRQEAPWDFALWAPSHQHVWLRLEDREIAMERDADGTHRLRQNAVAGMDYAFRIDDRVRPDPAARAQAGDVHGPSRLAAPSVPRPWSGRPWHEAVIYELHVGTFTREGTLAAAAKRLPELAALGITAVELMPIAQFDGARGWGYDGVLPYAPHPAYGTPEEVVAFTDAAHAAGLMAFLDVVYNHFGPSGAYLHEIAPEFFAPERTTPWGAAIDFHRPQVRDFFLRNAAMWVDDYGFDGLRLDAVHAFADASDTDILTEFGQSLAGRAAIIAEDDRNLPDWREDGAVTANWNDDFHHAVHVLLTGESEGYYAPFAQHPLVDLCAALQDGHVEQGQPRSPDRGRGAPSAHLHPTAFVNSNQTHDQVGNRARGERLISLADPEAVRVAHALLLTAPAIPMLFMGEEAGATAPFMFFAGFEGELAQIVREGRAAEFADFGAFGGAVPDPIDVGTFEASRPFAVEPTDAEDWRLLTRTLLTLRSERIAPLLAQTCTFSEARPLGPKSLRAEWRFETGRIVTHVNLGECPDQKWNAPGAVFSIGHPDHPLAFAIEVETE